MTRFQPQSESGNISSINFFRYPLLTILNRDIISNMGNFLLINAAMNKMNDKKQNRLTEMKPNAKTVPEGKVAKDPIHEIPDGFRMWSSGWRPIFDKSPDCVIILQRRTLPCWRPAVIAIELWMILTAVTPPLPWHWSKDHEGLIEPSLWNRRTASLVQ